MSMKPTGYYKVMSAVLKSRYSDAVKQELTGLLTKKLAQKLWTAFEEGLESGALAGLVSPNPLGTTEDAYKSGVLSLAAWLMAELEEEEEEAGSEEKEDEEEDKKGMTISMGLN